MMILAPATMVALFVAGCLIIFGVVLVGGARGGDRRSRSAGPPPKICQCGRPNPADARYCGRCGKRL